MSIQAGLKERAYAIAEMARTPDQIKAAQRSLSQAVQNGTLPSYVGIPLISELNQKMAKAAMPPAAPMAAPQQPPIAQQVMQQAQADQGVATLPSNLPQEEMAGGGIVAFAGGGGTDRGMIEALLGREEDESDEEYDEMVSALAGAGRMPDISRILKMVEDSNLPSDEGIESLSPVASKTFLTRTPEGAAVENVTRREGDGTVQVERDKKAISAEDDALLKYVLAKESGGRRYDRSGNLLTSPKGAQGEMQVMPGTQLDPGFGVEPARDRSPDEIARVGRDYLKAMRQRYGDDKLAAIAYNMGPGATDRWLASGADPARLPAETRQYVAGMAGGGAVRFQNRGAVSLGGIGDLAEMSAEEIRDAARRRLRMEQARAAFSAMPEAVAPPAATPSAATPSASSATKGMGTFGRIAGPLGLATLGFDIGKNVMERKQADELKKYGAEPEPTADELERASRPAFMKDVSMSPKEQQERGIKPLAPLTYTPAGVETYGPRPGYTPPAKPGKTGETGPVTFSGISPFDVDEENQRIAAEKARQEEAARYTAQDIESGPGAAGVGGTETAAGGKGAGTSEEEPKSKLEQLLEARLGRLDKQREEDKYLALLAAGLGIAGGTSPYALANIGQGGQAGVSSLLRSAATRTAEENAIMQGQLGLERYKSLADIRRQGLESQKFLKGLELDLRKQVEEGKITKAQEGQRLRAAEIARRMEQDYLGRAETTAKGLVSKNPLLSMDEGKSNAFVQDAVAAARNRLNLHTGYRNLMRQAYDGYDPGEIDVGQDMNDLLGKYLKPKK